MEFRNEQRQTHTMSPRLQHAVRLLQMSSLDFAAMLHDMLGRNPFLESEDLTDEAPAQVSADTETPSSFVEQGDGHEVVDGGFNDRELWHAEAASSLRRADDSELSSLDQTATKTTLHEHLQGQLNVLPLSKRDLLLASIIVESVDSDGYLRTSLEELADVAALDPEVEPIEMQIALNRVQALDPAGVGARDVAECLKLQLPMIVCPETRALAELIVVHHLPLLASRDITGLAQALQISPAEVESICMRLRRLDPRPGWRYESGQAPYIVPDVLARRLQGQWSVQLNPAVIPKVRLNQIYAELFQRHRNQNHGEMAAHLQEARWTLRNVEQRFSTILNVADAIVRRQRHFLEYGAMAMKPLCLKEIADEVGVHESTISRVTNNKYISTPTGVYELKYFFSRAMLSANGSACSGTAIRGLVKDIIEAEQPAQPLSDAEVARQLAGQGLVVARRTVTKYRQMLRIEAVERRRKHS